MVASVMKSKDREISDLTEQLQLAQKQITEMTNFVEKTK